MPDISDFEFEPLVEEAFMTFSSTPLPPSSHTAIGARATVRRRRQVRIGMVAGAVVLAIAVPLSANALVGKGDSHPNPGTSKIAPAPSSSPTASSTAPTSGPASPNQGQADGPTSDLTITASQLLTNGSAGALVGIAEVTVNNRGPAASDGVELSVKLPTGMRTSGSGWSGCDASGNMVTCHKPGLASGASRSYGLQVAFDTATTVGSPTVTAQPRGAVDPNQADNTVKLDICTNGCTGRLPTSDLSVVAGKVLTNGSIYTVTGTVKVTVVNHGPSPTHGIYLILPVRESMRPTGSGWDKCTKRDNQTMECVWSPGLAVDESHDFTFQYEIDLSSTPTDALTVTLPQNATSDPNQANNTAKLVICTNGGCPTG